mmetsp:Transcript_8696/g.18542  ORF Transcript_8696/g.18542 Transcript_8696/m.18542 type:complete len:670 (+) Transcript_8696:116-2125(+)
MFKGSVSQEKLDKKLFHVMCSEDPILPEVFNASILLKRGARVDAVNKEGLTLLERLWRSRCKLTKVKVELTALLMKNGAPFDEELHTHAMQETIREYPQGVRALVLSGLNMDAKSRGLQYAAELGNASVVQELLKFGADLVPEETSACALALAKSNGHTEVVRVIQSNLQSRTLDLHRAAARGDVQGVRLAVMAGVDVDSEQENDDSGDSALIIAARAGHAAVMRALLSELALLEYKNAAGETALIAASCSGALKAVEVLLARGAKVEAVGKHGSSALMRAAYAGHIKIVRALLNYGASIDAAEANGFTALMVASLNGHREVVGVLIARGAKLSARNYDGDSAIDCARAQGHAKVVQLLENVDAAKEAVKSLRNISEYSSAEHVTAWIDACADIEVQLDKDSKETPLIAAARSGNCAAVNVMLSSGADINAKNSNGQTALRIAAEEGHAEVVKRLLCRGANIEERTGCRERTALHAAAKAGHTTTVAVLLDHGANIDAREGSSENCESALDHAVLEEHEETARLLLDRGALLTKEFSGTLLIHVIRKSRYPRDFTWFTHMDEALRYIMQTNQNDTSDPAKNKRVLKIAALLLEHGEDVNFRGRGGFTALMAAACIGCVETVQLLLSHGADPHLKMRNDPGYPLLTALTFAQELEHIEVARLLRKAVAHC